MLSFTANLPSKLSSLQAIQQSINLRLQEEPPDRLGMHYDYGRLIKVMTLFEMVELIDSEPVLSENYQLS